MNRKNTATVITMALMSFFLLCVGQRVEAQQQCTLNIVQGSWVFYGQGTTKIGSDSFPFATNGTAVIKRNGTVGVVVNLNVDGVIIAHEEFGLSNIAVDRDCTATWTTDDGLEFFGVIYNRGQKISFIQANPSSGNTINIIFERR